jgi:hypothetical protein
MKLRLSSSRCESCPAKGEGRKAPSAHTVAEESPPEPVASLAPFLETGSAKRRHANVRAVGLRPRNLSSSRMPRVLFFFIEGDKGPRRTVGKAGAVSGGVYDHSTHEADGPVTREALASPGQMPVLRRAGYWSPTHDTYAGARVVGLLAQNKCPHPGRPQQGEAALRPHSGTEEPERWPTEAGSRRAA